MKKLYTPILNYLLILVLSFGFFEAKALTYTVTNTAVSGVGSFAQAILNANANPGADIINITATGTVFIAAVEITGPVTINSNASFIVDGTASNATRQNAWNTSLIVISSSNVFINDLKVQNAKPSLVANTWEGNGLLINNVDAITLGGISNVHLVNCSVTSSNANGITNSIWVASGNSFGLSKIKITNCTITGNGKAGVTFSQAANIQISGGIFTNNSTHGICFNGENTVGGIQIQPLASKAELALAKGVTNSSIIGATCSNNGVSNEGGGILLTSICKNDTISGCTVNSNYEHGIWLKLQNDNILILNNITNNNGLTGSELGCGVNISLSNNTNNLIKGNTSSGNRDYGIYLYDNYGTNGNDLNFIEANTVVKNLTDGIRIVNSNRTVIRNNFVGTDNTYASGLGNGRDGIFYSNSSTGGEVSGNVIVYNGENGVNITAGIDLPADAADPATVLIPKGGSNNNYIFNNYIGIDKLGVVKTNGQNGVVISESFGNLIGRSGPTATNHVSSPGSASAINSLFKNYISGNTFSGINLNNIDPTNATLNPKGNVLNPTVIEGNYIGTNLTGLAAAANGYDGINATSSSKIQILDNLISGNVDDGIQLGSSPATTADLITITGNIVGMDLNKTAALPNGGHGINLDFTTLVNIGDVAATGFTAKSNLVSGNVGNGIMITNNASNINVYYNHVGTNATGTSAFPNTIGISMTGANNNKLIGNLVSGNTSHGINILSASGFTTPNTVSKNYVGTNELGTAALANGGDGINLDNCNKNIIGGATAADGNLVSGNVGNGIALTNNSDFNQIDANIIGLNNLGNGIIANGKNGVELTLNANNNTIGTVFKNIISGNNENGIKMTGAYTNTIAKNIIGFGLVGNTIYSNNLDGISLNSGSNSNIIGGPLAADGNVIAGNKLNGISILSTSNSNAISNNLIGTTTTGTGAPAGIKQVIGVYINTSHGNTLNANTISNNSSHGVSLVDAGTLLLPNVIKSNMIGMNITGTNPILNAGNGINLSNSSYNTIGGTLAADGNVVSGNTGIGINLLANSSNNTLQNNFIGTNKAGTSKFANSVGISLTSSNTNTILSNLVSGNTGDGIVLSLSGSTAGNGNIINDNTIGFTNGGSVALANGGIGISLTQSSFNTIGTTGLPNVIGNHVGAGISLGTTSNSNTIAFNVVGLDKAKTTKAANDNGIVVTASNSNNINNNVISGNTNDGLVLDNASSNIVSTNIIGTNAAGSATDLGNGASNNGIGINLKNGAASNQIGLSNNVAYNQQSIVVDGLATTKNKISQNSIYCNLSNDIVPGINLKNSGNISFLTPFIVTQKPGLDTLGKQLVMGGITLALGSTVEVFQKDAGCTNCSQGKTYIGSTTVVATSPYLGDPDQGFVYNFAPATVLKKANCNDYIVTITDPAGNTSQFSTCSECVTTCTPSTVTDVVSKTECESALLKSFTATSTTNAADTYTWQKWNGVAYVDIVPSTTYAVTKSVAGAITTSTLTIDQITAAMNGDKFRLKVNTCGSDIFSNPVTEAVLTVNTLPVVTLDPIDANVCVGVNNTFTSTATGTGVTYKWQVDPNTGNFADITPAETAANLTLSNIQFSSNKYKYRVQVSGTCPPSTALYSLVANLKVDTVTAITIQPSNSTVCTGNDAGFKVKVIGRLDKTTDLPNLTYQWQVDPNTGTFVNTTDGAVYAGSTTDSLTVTTSAGMDLYKYRLVATGDCNPETSTSASIIFTTSPVLTTSPTSLPFCEGTNTTLTGAIANASSYKWEVTSDSLNWTTVVADANYSNVTTATLTITNTPLSFNRHRYRLVGKGACAPDVTTLEVILNVNEKPSIVTTPVLQTVCEGTNANFNVVAKGAGLSYQWQESVNNGAFANITNGGKYGITSATATTSSLAITPADSAMNNNKYQVIVSGTCTPAITSVPVLLTVNTTPKISNPANVTMCENETKTVSVSAKGTGVSVKWQYNNAGTYVDLVANPLLPFSTFNTNTLTITNPAIALTNTTYRVVASGTCPSPVNSTDFTLVVNEIPRVTVQPLPQTVCEGDNATYSVTATGTSTTYQWQVNNGSGWVPIGDGTFYSGTTTNTLTVNSALLAYNNYDYRAVVSGTCTPAVNSNPAKLNVNELPKITNQPATVTVCENGSKNFTVAAQGTGLVFNWELSTDGGATWSTLPVGAPYSAVTTVISANSSSSMLSISPITLLMATYKYRAVVTGTCATLTPVVSSEVGFILTTAPTITQHPADLSICVDANASFQALATPADGSLTFQWQIKKSGGAFVNVPNDPALYSINNESFAILAADASFANAQVQVIVTGACLPVLTSIPATISFVIPSVVVTPLDTICSGTTTKLGVTFPSGSNFSASWTVNKPTGVTGLSSMNFTSVNDSIKDKFDNTTNNDAYVTYTFLPRSAAGCLGTPVEAKVLVYPQTIPTLKGLNDICPGTIFTLTTQLFNHGKYTWYKDSDPVALVGDTTNVFTDTMSTLQEDYTVVFTDVCGNAYSADTSVVPIFGVEVYFDVPTKVCSDFPATFTSHVVSTNKDIDIYKWNFGAGAAATVVDSSITDVIYTYDDAGVYNVKLEAYFKGCLVGDSITPVTIQDCSIIAPNLFTPNGDGANDGWYIENIEYYPNASVTIFNRWGVIVWTAVNGYVNRWDGNNSEKQELEEGTYYYVIDLKSGDKKKAIKKGYITILRDIHSK